LPVCLKTLYKQENCYPIHVKLHFAKFGAYNFYYRTFGHYSQGCRWLQNPTNR